MIRTLTVLFGAAAVVAAIDISHKALAVSERGGAVLAHGRSAPYVAGLAAATLAWAGAIALVRSASIALAGGLVLGGAIGNLASFALWPSLPGVPDPLVAGGIAFNLADVSALLGLVLLVPAIVVFAARNRERLFEPVGGRCTIRPHGADPFVPVMAAAAPGADRRRVRPPQRSGTRRTRAAS